MNTLPTSEALPPTSGSPSLDMALRYDPFSGDMDCDTRILQDKIVTTRKPAECHHCAEIITPGQRARSRREVFDGTIESYKWCQTCTELMANLHVEGSEEKLDARCRTNS